MAQLIVTCKCGQKMKVPETALGKTGTCVGCGQQLKITRRNITPCEQGAPPAPENAAQDPKAQVAGERIRAAAGWRDPCDKYKGEGSSQGMSRDVVGGTEILSKKVSRIVRENMNKGEDIQFCLVGAWNQSLIALHDRVLIIKPGLLAGATFGARVTAFYYKDITGIEMNTGLTTAVLEILTPSYQGTADRDFWSLGRDRDPFRVSNCIPLHKPHLDAYRPYLERLRARIQQAKQATSSGTTEDIGTQIQKLVELRDSGALTEDEFQQAKRKLIG